MTVTREDLNRLYDAMNERFDRSDAALKGELGNLCTMLQMYADNAVLQHKFDCPHSRQGFREKKEELTAIGISVGTAVLVVSQRIL